MQPVKKSKNDIVSLSRDTLILGEAAEKEEVHIRKIQRTARNYMTTVDGINSKNNFEQMLRKMKKQFHCNGSYGNLTEESKSKQTEKSDSSVIRVTLTGDQRQNVMDFLTKEGICKKENIILHGC